MLRTQVPCDVVAAPVVDSALSADPQDPGGALGHGQDHELSGADRTNSADDVLRSALRLSVMRLARRLRAERQDDTHTLTQLSALASVHRYGPLTPGSLAECERVRPPSMTRVLAGLEDEGLVIRTPHPRDGRQVLVSITPRGRELLVADRRRRDAWLATQLVSLTEDERDILAMAAPLLDRLACR